jgi:hypothetical protein
MPPYIYQVSAHFKELKCYTFLSTDYAKISIGVKDKISPKIGD